MADAVEGFSAAARWSATLPSGPCSRPRRARAARCLGSSGRRVMSTRPAFGAVLKAKREAAGLSRAALGKLAGVSDSLIKYLELSLIHI